MIGDREMKLARISAFLDEFLDQEKLILQLADGGQVSILAVAPDGTAYIEQGEDGIGVLPWPLDDDQVDALYAHVMARKHASRGEG